MSNVTFDFSDESFAVVGASSGMGRQIALDLAEAGAQVLAIARNQERLDALAAQAPEKIETVSLDVLSATDDAWDAAVGSFVKKNGKLSGGVYTAGTIGPTPLRMFDRAMADNIAQTGFLRMMDFLHCATKKKNANHGSSYVVFSSAAAYCGQKGYWAYNGTKAAVQAAVRSIAKEISRDGHRINSISPGTVQTEMTWQSQEKVGFSKSVEDRHLFGFGKPEDISAMVMFLLSQSARWITGTDVLVDGGYVLYGD